MSATMMAEGTSSAAKPVDSLVPLRFHGPLTAGTSARMRQRLRESVARGDTRVCLDLEAVTALDASGVAALLDASRLVEGQPGGCLTVRANALVLRALKESGTVAAFKLGKSSGM